MGAPIPTRIKLHKASRTLELGYADGSTYQLPAEYLRVLSPSAEVRGHGKPPGATRSSWFSTTATTVACTPGTTSTNWQPNKRNAGTPIWSSCTRPVHHETRMSALFASHPDFPSPYTALP